MGVVDRALLLVLLAAPGAAAAPAAPAPEPPRRPGRFKLSVLYLTPRLELRNAGVDTNVYNSPDDPVADTSVVLRPSLAAVLPVGRRLQLLGRGWFDVNYFRSESSERSVDAGGEGGARLHLWRLTLQGLGGSSRARQRFAIDLDQRVQRRERWASGSVALDLTTRWSLTGAAESRRLAFAEAVADGVDVRTALDRDSLSLSGRSTFRLTRQTSLVLSAEAIEDRFPREPDASIREVRSGRYLGGFEFGERALINGRMLAGVRRFPAGTGVPAYQGLAASVSTRWPLFRFGRLTLGADRDVRYAVSRPTAASGAARNSYVWTRLSSLAGFELPLGFIGTASVSHDDARFLLPTEVAGAPLLRRDRLLTAGGSLGRRLGDGVRIGVSLERLRRTSNQPGASYEGWRYGLTGDVAP